MAADLVQTHLANGLTCPLPASSPLARQLRSERTWLGPSAKERLGILRRAKSVAVVGFSTKPSRASYFVGTYLVQSTDYTVYFVNPNAAGQTVLGQKIYASLADLPEVPDIVDVFRKPSDIPGVVDEVASLTTVDGTPPVLWVQLGIWNEAAAYDAQKRGLTVVMDRCLKIEHARFHGGLHLLGFDTGQITARKTIR
ncbi:CoA-binding protein [Glycomyces sp. NRRL B-16210]|uniref:CoA-binding protein n=1 Tax=Glycomyces sp. NRRL B-16210 TaxID=1463821 RepID=UPI0004BF6A0A|nr:CoA-binding protein [Glycomyces sp. NRRL B-16210]